MRAYRCLPVAFAALLPVAANAACEPSFVEGSNIVTITPPVSFDNQRLVERFSVRVRNDGSEVCTLRLGVGREIASTGLRFPVYSLTGPSGNEPVAGLSGTGDSTGFGSEFIVPANGQVSVPYELRMAVGWGSEAGTYAEDLVFQLLDVQSGREIAGQRTRSGRAITNQRTRLSLEIPRSTRIRFAGASRGDGPARIEMGPLSATAPTRSPPFALRILSTSAYRIDLVSQNRGALRRSDGPDLIPYRMTLGGQAVNLSGAAYSRQIGRATSSVGDVHPVTIVIDPDSTRHAGQYSDRVTVTVTAI